MIGPTKKTYFTREESQKLGIGLPKCPKCPTDIKTALI